MIPRSSTRRRTAVALAVLIALIICLHVVGRFGLQGPARLSVESVRAWARDPVEVVATITRWLSLILAYYLVVVVGVVAVLGERLEDRRTRRFAPSTLTAVIGLLLGTTAVVAPLVSRGAETSTAPINLIPESLSDGGGDRVEPLVLRELDLSLIHI